jgi:hypothetical protein
MTGVTKEDKLFYWPVAKHLKGNYSLIPIFVVIAIGITLPAWQIVRTLRRSPDVHLSKTKNPRPWESLETADGKAVQFKYWTAKSKDYNEYRVDRPKLD